jgi:tryptophan synthase beta chain
MKMAKTGELGDLVVINLSGRGDKDLETVFKLKEEEAKEACQ